MRLLFRGITLALGLGFCHLACGGDDDGGNVTQPSDDGGATTDTGNPSNPDNPVPDAAVDTSPPPIATVTTESIDVDGTTRTYVLAVPRTFDASKTYPLILELHGDGEDGAGMQNRFPFENASDQEAIIAYPNGNGWNLYGAGETNADVAFLKQLVSALQTKYNADPARVMAFGYSSGAFMANQLACKLDGFVRAIGPNEGGAPADDPNGTGRTCTNNSPVGVFVFHGDADTTVDVGSGRYETKFWAQRNGCSATASDPVTPAPCVQQKNCPAAAPVVYCEIPGQGHTVWSQAAAASFAWFKALP